MVPLEVAVAAKPGAGPEAVPEEGREVGPLLFSASTAITATVSWAPETEAVFAEVFVAASGVATAAAEVVVAVSAAAELHMFGVLRPGRAL